jgi:cell division protein FtsN
MDSNAESSRRRRTNGLVLNPVQVGLAVGFIAVALLIVFGLGVIIGMWYQASGHMSTYADAMPAAGEQPTATPDPGSTSPAVTFYSTLTTSETTPLPSPPSTPGEAQEAPASPAHRVAPPLLVPPVAPPPSAPATGGATPPSSRVASKPSPPPEPFYSVQVGSFRVAEQAETLRQRLLRKGYDVRVRLSMVPGQGAWYRVRVGQFPTREAAEGVARRLHAQEQIPVMVAVD